jgi:hypothetical protein
MLCRQGEIQIIITPINVPGEQTAALLARVSVGIAIYGETATPANIAMSAVSYRHDSPYLLMPKAIRFYKCC